MANTESTNFTYTYKTLSKLTGLSETAIYQHKTRKKLDPHSLESVVVWLAANGKDSLREEMNQAHFQGHRFGTTRAKKKALNKS